VRPDSLDDYDSSTKRYRRDQPVFLPFQVENGPGPADETHGRVARSYVLLRLPFRLVRFRQSSSHLLPNVRVPLDEIGEDAPPRDFHAGFRTVQFPLLIYQVPTLGTLRLNPIPVKRFWRMLEVRGARNQPGLPHARRLPARPETPSGRSRDAPTYRFHAST
jgi:hypothetical protein